MRTRRKKPLCERLWCGVLLGAVVAGPAYAEDQPIGYVKTLSGSATVYHEDNHAPARQGGPVYQSDRVETASGSSVGITFQDNTRVALGPMSRIEISSFTFKPAEKQYSFVVRVVRGTLAYISGLIAKLAPDTVSIELPTATFAVRGTHLLIREEE